MKKDYSPTEKRLLKNLGEKIRFYRKREDISQEELADRSELDRAYIGRVERGEKNISIISLKKISEALNTDITKFFNGQVNK